VEQNAALENLLNTSHNSSKKEYSALFLKHDLERCWPSSGMSRAERERKIQDFAESQGWTAAILDTGSGTRAIFQKLEPSIDEASH
jgi:hypothetical protein